MDLCAMTPITKLCNRGKQVGCYFFANHTVDKHRHISLDDTHTYRTNPLRIPLELQQKIGGSSGHSRGIHRGFPIV